MDLVSWGPDYAANVGPDIREYTHPDRGTQYYFLNWYIYSNTDGINDIGGTHKVQNNGKGHRMYCNESPYDSSTASGSEKLLEIEWRTSNDDGRYVVDGNTFNDPNSGPDSNHFNDSHIVIRWDSAYLHRYSSDASIDATHFRTLNKYCWVCIEEIWNDMQSGTTYNLENSMSCNPSQAPYNRIVMAFCPEETQDTYPNAHTFPLTGWGHTHRYTCTSGVISGTEATSYDRPCILKFDESSRPYAEWEPYKECIECEYSYNVC